jgi:DNA modification methylase
MIDLRMGDCLSLMGDMEDNSVDSIVTDPPYGLSFMGKKWDYDVPKVEIWKEALRVLKPGGYLLSFAGTRTQHRMCCNIEDAGFEIRDMIAWVYGSGFPKSLNIGKAVDKLQGNEREEIKDYQPFGRENRKSDGKAKFGVEGWETKANPTDTKGTSEWEGWGTAVKPSWESLTYAQKPLHYVGYCSIMKENLTKLCSQIASDVKKKSKPTQAESSVEKTSIAQENVETQQEENQAKKMETGKVEDINSEVDMLESVSEKENTALNTLSLWKSILEEVSDEEKMSTTSTELETIIDWKILSYCLSQTTPDIIIKANSNPNGLKSDVLPVINYLNASFALLKNTLTLSALAPVMFEPSKETGITPNLEPIIMSRKPLSEKTVAENVLKWGTGGLNIDKSRVGTGGHLKWESPRDMGYHGGTDSNSKATEASLGRFPANLIHDGSEEVEELFPDTKSGAVNKQYSKKTTNPILGKGLGQNDVLCEASSGSASRFFYCAKASKKDRNEGCEGMEEKRVDSDFRQGGAANNRSSGKYAIMQNTHPTVKPTALMQYLVRLVTPPNGTCLDPFMGSGSTGKACVIEGFNFIGIEMEQEYYNIAKKRIEGAQLPLF